jgi:hypothetical protein
MKLKRLSSKDFDRVAATTQQGERAVAMARAVLVDGRAQADVAAEYGMTKQRVNGAVATIERAYAKSAESSSGWVTVELELPEPWAQELDRLLGVLLQCEDEAARARVCTQVLRSLRAAGQDLA